ncbi:MAG: TonB-dependent receptor [Acidobacteriaceae bacterium]|nr:TonB-dependent receptor [Acidobacteriaceae bacterium]
MIGTGQQLTGRLGGTAYDQTGAVIPNAQVVVKNQANNTTRTTIANSDGYFTVTALQPGTYTVTVSASGFGTWEQRDIVLNQGDERTLPNISLQVGAASQQVEVLAESESVAPVDTGEVSTTLNTSMVNDVQIQGRNAGEFLKIMPGMALTNGLSQGSGFNAQTVGTNSGPAGNYSPNGQQPNGAMAFMLDGANLVDPGNQGTQIANINQDMTSEIKVLMSGYDAAYAKGPVVFQAFSKSGGAKFHGEGYLYARNGVFNSIDAYQKSQGSGKADNYQYYPGGNIGGPVLLPFTHFNRNRDKLFFWFGYEYMRQQPTGNLWQTFVPTTEMRNGNFSPAYLGSLPAIVQQKYGNITAAPCPASATNPGVSSKASCGNLVFPNGQIPTSLFDPNALALLKTYPQPNVDPATHGGNNFQYLDQSPVNRWEQTEKIDYSISENTKLTVSYAHQAEKDIHPVQVWWAPSWSLPYPSPLVAPTTSNVVMVNATHVFNPTLTNETVFTYARYINPITPQSPSAINPSNLGFNVPGLFGAKRVQIPNIISWGGNGGFAGYDTQAVFGGAFQGGAFGGLKSDPAIYDNVTKVSGTHTMRFGFYWDLNGNQQSSGQAIQGTYDFETYGGTSTGNLYADYLLGRAANYAQASAIPVDNLKFHQYSFYGQDSWKASKRLTLNYGIRFDHIGQWYNDGAGIAVFNFGAYQANPTAVNAGLQWNAINKNVPLSGFKSPLFYYEPRIGVAYDIFGNGRTVLRGGYAIFRYQISFNTVQSPSEIPFGVVSATVPSNGGLTSLAQITQYNPSSTSNLACGTSCSVQALAPGDGHVPTTENYNFTISQTLPGRSLMELSYVGNRSRNLVTQGTNADFNNPNMVPLGAFFRPDPITGVINPIYQANFPTGDYRPLQSYGDIWMVGHGSYANYNSLQASWQKQAGPVTFLANYTFGKVLGIRDNVSTNGPSAGNTVNPFNVRANYGVLGYDHTHIFNAAYVWKMPSFVHGNAFLAGTVNGWQLSGTTQLQSGAPIQPNTNGNLNANYGNVTINGNLVGVGANSWLGSNAPGLALVPLLTCDPRTGLKSGQYFNPSCFTVPAQGQNGTLIWPYIHGPAFFNSDLAIYKNFNLSRFKEGQSVQLRFSAFNFLNHPNKQFNLNGNTDTSLNFSVPTDPNHALSLTNTNASTTGAPLYKTGFRIVEFAIKYYF